MLRFSFEPKKPKIAVVVSAWDLLVEPGLRPDEWLTR